MSTNLETLVEQLKTEFRGKEMTAVISAKATAMVLLGITSVEQLTPEYLARAIVENMVPTLELADSVMVIEKASLVRTFKDAKVDYEGRSN
jgi:transcriptional regulator NrdR family protein